MEEEELIGKRIREFRQNKGMTVSELAQKSGFSQGYLSKLETSSKAPPVGTLLKLSKILDVRMSDIFGETDDEQNLSIIRKNIKNEISHEANEYGYIYQSLAHSIKDQKMNPFLMTFPAKPQKPYFAQHEGQEFVYLLNGSLRFIYAGSEYIINKGDSVYFDSSVEHSAVGVTKNAQGITVFFRP